MAKNRFVPATDEATISGTYVEVDSATGLAKKIEQLIGLGYNMILRLTNAKKNLEEYK